MQATALGASKGLGCNAPGLQDIPGLEHGPGLEHVPGLDHVPGREHVSVLEQVPGMVQDWKMIQPRAQCRPGGARPHQSLACCATWLLQVRIYPQRGTRCRDNWLVETRV